MLSLHFHLSLYYSDSGVHRRESDHWYHFLGVGLLGCTSAFLSKTSHLLWFLSLIEITVKTPRPDQNSVSICNFCILFSFIKILLINFYIFRGQGRRRALLLNSKDNINQLFLLLTITNVREAFRIGTQFINISNPFSVCPRINLIMI